MLTGDFAPQNDHNQNQADRQIEVLRAHTEAERQAVAQDADNQRRTVPMMLPLPPVFSVPPSTTAVMMASV